MTDKKTRWSTNGKIRIVLQTFNPETKVAELCREHNLAPRTLYTWRERFLQGGRESLGSLGSGRTLKRQALVNLGDPCMSLALVHLGDLRMSLFNK